MAAPADVGPVLVPVLYAGSVLELILASGVASGVGLVLLVPLIWSALFHRQWESACVVVAVVAVQAVSSIVQAYRRRSPRERGAEGL